MVRGVGCSRGSMVRGVGSSMVRGVGSSRGSMVRGVGSDEAVKMLEEITEVEDEFVNCGPLRGR